MLYEDSMNKTFKFDANEYSKILQISQSALRKRRLSGKLEGLFIEDKGKYFYALPRPNKGRGTPLEPRCLSRVRRRHVASHLTRYPNTKFETHNDIKQLARIKKLLREEEIEHITPDIIAVAKQRHQEELDKRLNDPFILSEEARAKKRFDDMLMEQDRIECGDYDRRKTIKGEVY